ncbi:MAG: ATP-binding protein, partial [Bacteroidota bacterium]
MALDSVANLLEQYPAVALATLLLEQRQRLAEATGNSSEALAFARQNVALQASEPDTLRLAQCHERLGLLLAQQHQLAEAQASLQVASALWQSLGNARRASLALDALGLTFQNQGRLDSALHYHLQATQLLEELQDTLMLADAYNNLGLVYQRDRQWSRALHFYDQAEVLHQYLQRPLQRAQLYCNYAETLAGRSQFSEAQAYLDSAFQEPALDASPTAKAYANLVQGNLLHAQSRYREALASYDQIGQTPGNLEPRARMIWSLNAGACYFELGQYSMALPQYRQALELAEELGARLEESYALNSLAEVLAVLGQSATAYSTLRRFDTLRFSLIDKERERARAEMEEKYQTVVQQRHIDQLAADALLQAEVTQRRTQQRNAFAGGVVLLFISGLLDLLFRQRKKAQRLALEKAEADHQQKVTALMGELRQAAAQALMSGQDQERQRIAQDLHDQLGGTLAAVNLQLSSLQTLPNYQEAHHQTQGLMQVAIQSVRSISHNLAGGRLAQEGLVPTLQHLVQTLDTNGDIEFSLEANASRTCWPHPLERTLYQCLLELVGNAIRHAQPHSILITVEEQAGHLCLSVTDDGTGMAAETANAAQGLGLKGIQERMVDWAGSMFVDSLPGDGTTVCLQVPMHAVYPPKADVV